MDFVKHKPMEYKVTIGERGLEASFEIKLKVLTSQLEDMLFRIRFRGLDVLQGKLLCDHMVVTSAPIKVISKPERTSKRPRVAGKKKNTNDEILATLEAVQQRQTDQYALLQQLLHDAKGGSGRPRVPPTPNPAPSLGLLTPPSHTVSPYQGIMSPFTLLPEPSVLPRGNPEMGMGAPPGKKQKIDDDRTLDFETSFHDMLKAFESLSADTRPRLMEEFVRTHRVGVDHLTELHDMLSQGALDRTIGRSVSQPHAGDWMSGDGAGECYCENCPFKKEVQARQDFYNDFVSWLS